MKIWNKEKRRKHYPLLALFLSIILFIPASSVYAEIYGFIMKPRFSYEGADFARVCRISL